MLTQIETNKDRVREILKQFPQARDNDTVLYFLYAKLYTNVMDTEAITPNQFANKVLVSAMPPSESLSRTRRLIQSNEGLYRGKKYEQRQAAAQEVRAGLACGTY